MESSVLILIRQQSKFLVVWHLNTTLSRLSPILNHAKTFTSNPNLIINQSNKLLMLGISMRLQKCPWSMSTQSRPNQECTIHLPACHISIGMYLKPKRWNQSSTIVCGQGRPSIILLTVTSQFRTPMMSLMTWWMWQMIMKIITGPFGSLLLLLEVPNWFTWSLTLSFSALHNVADHSAAKSMQ